MSLEENNNRSERCLSEKENKEKADDAAPSQPDFIKIDHLLLHEGDAVIVEGKFFFPRCIPFKNNSNSGSTTASLSHSLRETIGQVLFDCCSCAEDRHHNNDLDTSDDGSMHPFSRQPLDNAHGYWYHIHSYTKRQQKTATKEENENVEKNKWNEEEEKKRRAGHGEGIAYSSSFLKYNVPWNEIRKEIDGQVRLHCQSPEVKEGNSETESLTRPVFIVEATAKKIYVRNDVHHNSTTSSVKHREEEVRCHERKGPFSSTSDEKSQGGEIKEIGQQRRLNPSAKAWTPTSTAMGFSSEKEKERQEEEGQEQVSTAKITQLKDAIVGHGPACICALCAQYREARRRWESNNGIHLTTPSLISTLLPFFSFPDPQTLPKPAALPAMVLKEYIYVSIAQLPPNINMAVVRWLVEFLTGYPIFNVDRILKGDYVHLGGFHGFVSPQHFQKMERVLHEKVMCTTEKEEGEGAGGIYVAKTTAQEAILRGLVKEYNSNNTDKSISSSSSLLSALSGKNVLEFVKAKSRPSLNAIQLNAQLLVEAEEAAFFSAGTIQNNVVSASGKGGTAAIDSKMSDKSIANIESAIMSRHMASVASERLFQDVIFKETGQKEGQDEEEDGKWNKEEETDESSYLLTPCLQDDKKDVVVHDEAAFWFWIPQSIHFDSLCAFHKIWTESFSPSFSLNLEDNTSTRKQRRFFFHVRIFSSELSEEQKTAKTESRKNSDDIEEQTTDVVFYNLLSLKEVAEKILEFFSISSSRKKQKDDFSGERTLRVKIFVEVTFHWIEQPSSEK